MLCPELLQPILTQIRIEFEERRETFRLELQTIQNKLSVQGLGWSGAMQRETQRALMCELNIRARLAWQALSQILSSQSLAIDLGLNRQLKEEIGSHLATGCDDLIAIHQSACKNLPGSTLPSFEVMRENALTKIGLEIDLFLLPKQRRREMKIIARQLSQLVRDAQRDLGDELVRDQLEFTERTDRRDIRLHITSLCQKWRDKCVSSSELVSENYLNNCISLDIDPNDFIPILGKELGSFIDETYKVLKFECHSSVITRNTTEPYEQYFSEAEEMMRPYLERRISEIIENTKDGFCRGVFITKTTLPYQNIITASEITMGDKYENVHSSTIINRSSVERSFNKLKVVFDEETANALKSVADEIERSNNQDAAENFASFNEELQKPEPKKAVLRALWSGITTALPTIAQVTDVVTKIERLLS